MLENIELNEEYRQKLSALKNYSLTMNDFQEWGVLEGVAYYCNKKGASKSAIALLDWLLDELGIDYLDWKCRTKWVKDRIASKNCKRGQMQFNLQEADCQMHTEWKRSIIPSNVYEHHYFRIGEATQ